MIQRKDRLLRWVSLCSSTRQVRRANHLSFGVPFPKEASSMFVENKMCCRHHVRGKRASNSVAHQPLGVCLAGIVWNGRRPKKRPSSCSHGCRASGQTSIYRPQVLVQPGKNVLVHLLAWFPDQTMSPWIGDVLLVLFGRVKDRVKPATRIGLKKN